MKCNVFLAAAIALTCSTRSLAFSPSGRPAAVSSAAVTTRLYSSAYLDSLSTAGPIASTTSPPASIPIDGSAPQTASREDFPSITTLGLEHADAIATNAVACCKRNGFNPVTVVVLDANGSTIVSKRMDGCPPVVFPDFALAKATTSVLMGYPSRTFRDKYTADEASAKFCQMTSMVDISGGKMAPFPGGIVLKLGDDVIGAVGVSGASGDEDEYCAIRGVIESGLGLATLPETHSCSTVKDHI